MVAERLTKLGPPRQKVGLQQEREERRPINVIGGPKRRIMSVQRHLELFHVQ